MSTWTPGQKYRMELRLRSGALQAVIPFKDLQGEFYAANKPDQIRFKLPLYFPSITSTTLEAGLTECWLYRNNSLIFAGPVWDTTATSSEGNISCAAQGLESYLETRHVAATDPQTVYNNDQGEIGWTWINDAQAVADGNLFITKGTVQPSVTRQRTVKFESGLYIFDEIDEFAQLDDGIDWKILPNRAYTVWYPRRAGVATARLEFPGTIRRYSVNAMGKWIRNKVLVHGNEDVNVTATAPTSRTRFGLREWTESATNLQALTSLTARANHVRDARQTARINPNIGLSADINPFEASSGLALGQSVGVRINDGFVNIDQVMRFVGFQLSLGKQENETFVLYMNEPWEG